MLNNPKIKYFKAYDEAVNVAKLIPDSMSENGVSQICLTKGLDQC
jgi:hypothetical protein